MAIERELSFEERAKYGECPVCHAQHGEACDGAIGIPLGRNCHGDVPPDGAHLGRLQRAPFAVREVPIR